MMLYAVAAKKAAQLSALPLASLVQSKALMKHNVNEIVGSGLIMKLKFSWIVSALQK